MAKAILRSYCDTQGRLMARGFIGHRQDTVDQRSLAYGYIDTQGNLRFRAKDCDQKIALARGFIDSQGILRARSEYKTCAATAPWNCRSFYERCGYRDQYTVVVSEPIRCSDYFDEPACCNDRIRQENVDAAGTYIVRLTPDGCSWLSDPVVKWTSDRCLERPQLACPPECMNVGWYQEYYWTYQLRLTFFGNYGSATPGTGRTDGWRINWEPSPLGNAYGARFNPSNPGGTSPQCYGPEGFYRNRNLTLNRRIMDPCVDFDTPSQPCWWVDYNVS